MRVRQVAIASALWLGAAILLVLVVARWGPLQRFDVATSVRFDRATAGHPVARSCWLIVSDVLQPNVWRVIGAVVSMGWVMRGRRADAVDLAAALIGAAALSTVIKQAVGRARPRPVHVVAHAGGASFPSGHALTAAAISAVLVIVWGRARPRGRIAIAGLAGALVVAVSLSRVALAVHYPSDVVAGVLLGLALAATICVRRAAVASPYGEPDETAGTGGDAVRTERA